MTSTTTDRPASPPGKAQRRHPDEIVIGLVSISDRASSGVYEDKGIPALQEWLGTALSSPWQVVTRLIQDDAATISATLTELVDDVNCDLVLTTGGTGPSRRDVTPEATLAVASKPMPGFGEQMRQISLNFVPTAILSRQVAVIRETADHAALIVNLPGQPKSIKETLEGLRDADGAVKVPGIFAAVPYCIDLIGGPYVETHAEVVKAFRPKNAVRAAQPDRG
ncbi:molybdopterin adenylyltransferase [Paraburkholderia sp. D15]|uniref:molybdopterin adenylyltransferase n=1 Tax=Paraburkholderia sp. D15 TaxID=2880218 RepID=UPI00247AC7B2|nr:molybdopterin adenylyltransferase [Paraburkholderia sp. D15]WGS48976.1 molybdopterin adenylyltransferase [Paraburkholderia sp. D15]